MSRRAKILGNRLHLYKLTSGDFGYLAGLTDGEGSIIFINPNKSNTYRRPRVTIVNSDVGVMDWLSSLGVETVWFNPPKTSVGRKRKMGHWRVDRILDVRDLLLGILPYLKIKHTKAKRALEVCEQIIQGGDVTYYD